MENPIRMDDLGGFPIIFGNTHMVFAGRPMLVSFNPCNEMSTAACRQPGAAECDAHRVRGDVQA